MTYYSLVTTESVSWYDALWRGLAYSFAHQRLAVLHARLGRAAEARRHWNVFSETFTTPDRDLMRLVEEARGAVNAK